MAWLGVWDRADRSSEPFGAARLRGASYRAANWLCVGRTKGRGRRDRRRARLPVKQVYLYPLQRDYRRLLSVPA